LERFASKGDPSKLSVQNPARIGRMLAALDFASAPTDLAVPGWCFHELTGDRKGTYSITVSGNWRITFRWDGADAVDVDMEDYH
jgi:proteic killer suppression protein